MSNVFYRPFVDENNERYWLFFEHGRVHAPILVLDEWTAVRFSERVMALYEPPQAYTEAVDRFYHDEMDCNHTWLEDLIMDGEIVIADHICKHCNKLGMQNDDDPLETVYPVEYECEGCGRLFASGLHHLECPHCGHDNIPF